MHVHPASPTTCDGCSAIATGSWQWGGVRCDPKNASIYKYLKRWEESDLSGRKYALVAFLLWSICYRVCWTCRTKLTTSSWALLPHIELETSLGHLPNALKDSSAAVGSLVVYRLVCERARWLLPVGIIRSRIFRIHACCGEGQTMKPLAHSIALKSKQVHA